MCKVVVELTYERARPRHAVELARVMRTRDAEEVWAASGKDVVESLRDSIEQSAEAYVGYANRCPAAIFGIVPQDIVAGHAVIWLLTSRMVEEFPLTFVRESKRLLDFFQVNWPVLGGAVDERYEDAMRFLKLLGFEIGERLEANGYGFRAFVRRK